MKKKYIKDTYLRAVTDVDIKITKDDALNAYTVIKKINSTNEPYISNHTGEDICLIDDGYYVIEQLPLDEKYLVRAFFNKDKVLKGYYIDIVKENALENNELYYLDLYLDITVDKLSNGESLVMVWDANELKSALEVGKITKEDYVLAHKELVKLFSSIANEENIYMLKCLEDIKNI
ncbi:MAG: DUF402 domain-containing protein [Clostridia bacterium]